jgi:Homeodomain
MLQVKIWFQNRRMKQKKRQREDDCRQQQQQPHHRTTIISDDANGSGFDRQTAASVCHQDSNWKWNDGSDETVDFTGSDDVEADEGLKAEEEEEKGDEAFIGIASPMTRCRPMAMQPPHPLCYDNILGL